MFRERMVSLIGLLDKARTQEEKEQLLEQLVKKENEQQEATNSKHAELFEEVLAMLKDKTKEHRRFLRNVNGHRHALIEIGACLTPSTGEVSYLIKSDVHPPFVDQELGFVLISKKIVRDQPAYTFLHRFLIFDFDKLAHCLPSIIEHKPSKKRSWFWEDLLPQSSFASSLPCYYSHLDYEKTLVKNLKALIEDIPSWTPVE